MTKKVRVVAFIATIVLVLMALGGCTEYKENPKNVNELDGYTIGVQTGTLYEDYLYEASPDVNVEFYSDYNTMILAVEQGKLDGYTTETNSFPIEKKHHPVLEEIDGYLAEVTCGVAFNINGDNLELQSQMQEFIDDSMKDGTLKELDDYWVQNFDPDNCVTDKSNIDGKNGKIKIAVEGGYEPMSYMGNGELQGLDIDFAYRFCRKYGYEPEFIAMDFDALSAAIVSNKVDFGMNIIIEDERQEEIALTTPYIVYNVVVAVAGGEKINKGFIASIGSSFYKTFLKENRWKQFAQGACVTAVISLLSVLLGTILGFIAYLSCKNGNKTANFIMNWVSKILHGMPAVVLLMIIYYMVFKSIKISGIIVSVICFSLLFGCSVFDMIEGGVKAVGREQYEAARAQGFSSNDAFFKIILPQAAQHFMPIFRGEVVSLIKETAIVGYIAVIDLTKMSDMIRSRTYEAFFPLIATAIIYFVIEWLLTIFVGRIEISIDPQRRKIKKILRGINVNR